MYFCPSKRKLLVNDAIESKYIHIIHTTIPVSYTHLTLPTTPYV